MAMNKPLFDIEQNDVQVMLTHYQPGAGMAWQQLFPLKSTRKFDLKGLEGNEGIAVSAERVSFNTKAPLKTREVVGTWSGKLAKNAVAREQDETIINEYNDLKAIAAASNDPQAASDLVDMVYNDVDFVNKAMDMKNEIDCLRIASSGVMTFPEEIDGDNATADTINFNVPSGNFGGASTVWSNAANADGIADIIAMTDHIAAQGYPKPRYAYMDKSAWLYLRAQSATATRLFPNAKNIAVYAQMINLENVNAYMAQNGYPEIRYTDSYARVEDKKGNKKVIKPWNVNVVTLAPEENLGHTYWKAVPNVPNVGALQTQGNYYKLTQYSDVNPMVEVTMAEAYIQPVLENRRSTCFINIKNTSWNNGAE